MAFLGLRRKILLGLLATTLLFAALMVGFAHTVVRGQLAALLTEKGVAIARKIAADCVSPAITERYFEIEMLFKDLQASFLKRADGDVVFRSDEGRRVAEAVARADETGERVTIPVEVVARVPARHGDEPVARFTMGLTLKRPA